MKINEMNSSTHHVFFYLEINTISFICFPLPTQLKQKHQPSQILIGSINQPQASIKIYFYSFTYRDPTNSNVIVCMDKEEFHWVFGVMRGWFSAKLGSKISDGSQLCQHNFWGHQQPQGHNIQKSTTFILLHIGIQQTAM
jgi:hypothetical protein